MKSVSDIRPAIILPLGNGAYHYNYNIVEVQVKDEEGKERTEYHYDTVKVWGEPEYKSLVRAVIREELDETEEFSMINGYYSGVLGVTTDEAEKAEAEEAYKAHLQMVANIKVQVKTDLAVAKY